MSHTNDPASRFNQLVEEALDLVKSHPDGIYMKDLKSLLNASAVKMDGIATRFRRMTNMTVTEVRRDGQRPDLLFKYARLPTEDTFKPSPHTDTTSASRFNQLVEEALDLVKSHPDGIYMKDLKSLLNASAVKMDGIATRFRRMTNMTVTEVRRDGQRPDLLFKYAKHQAECIPESRPEVELAENAIGKDIPSTQVKNSLEELAQQMLDEYYASQKTIDKDLQKKLTVEFLRVGSVNAMVKKYPNIPKETIKIHIRTPLRLPKKLRALNEDGLHTDPQISLQIALFAVNRHDWDSDDGDTEDVLQTAEGISRHLSVASRDGGDTLRSHTHQKDIAPPTAPISTPKAVWIAVATLHKERGLKMTFSTNQIIERIREQNLCNVSDSTIVTHVSSHCVANSPAAIEYPHRKTYRVGHGMYRLYKKGDPCHPTRESGSIAPLPFQLPRKYKDLRRWYDEEYCAQA